MRATEMRKILLLLFSLLLLHLSFFLLTSPHSQAVVSQAFLVQEEIFLFGKFNKLPVQPVLSHDKGVFHT